MKCRLVDDLEPEYISCADMGCSACLLDEVLSGLWESLNFKR